MDHTSSAYTPLQVSGFLSYIGHSPSLHENWFYSAQPERDLRSLTQLYIRALVALPYDNIPIHYDRKNEVSTDPIRIYNKIVGRNRGGCCMENNILLHHILRGLGFSVYSAAAKTRARMNGVPHGPFSGWSHIVNIVTLSDDVKYLIDAGFGADGPTKPVPLLHDQPQWNLENQYIRLVKENTSKAQLWTYQYGGDADTKWTSFYHFIETESAQPDFRKLSNPSEISIVVARYIGRRRADPRQDSPMEGLAYPDLAMADVDDPDCEDDGDTEIVGKVTLEKGVVREEREGKARVLQQCRSAEEQVLALKKWFGIDLV